MAELLLDKARDTWLSTQHSLQLAAAASVLDMLNPLFWLGLAAVGSVEAATYGNNHVTTRKDPNVLAAQFPSPNTTLLAPAFLSPETIPAAFVNGTEGPTDDAELDSFLRFLADRNEWMSYSAADFQSEEGRSFPYVLLSSPTTNTTKKLRVWLQGGVHGNEPAGDQSLLALLGKLDANQTWADTLLTNLDVLVLPRYNPDGVAYFQRTLATNYDPNRDHIKLARAQTRAIKRLFTAFAPHVAADMHEFTATRRQGAARDLVWAADALFSAAKNLNIDGTIRALSEDLFAARIAARLEEQGLRWDPYVTTDTPSGSSEPIALAEAGSDGKIGRNAMGLTQSVTFLCEMRGIGIADQHFKRRTATGLAMAEAIVQTAAENFELVYETVEAGIKRFAESREDIVVTDYTETTDRTFAMISASNGSIVQQPVKFDSTTPTIANLTRSRPAAYLIPRSWADVAARLEVYGLEVEELPEVFSGTVEVLNITSAVLESSYYEGVVRAKLTTEAIEKEIELPAGSFRVSTKQKNAALAFVALEPENIDSLAAFNIIPVEAGDEYPIFRVL
ncbi:putative carboxypeptidase 2 protein [Neofusicoccum parvum UCRNP2]|uniref:Carboxypeptidase M14B n=1 Tax=Botryosphaeria parva (strain UCR-NP2) TaxID=1287680 RepID=R1GFM2_BOTPV|nr:putative carboxypeptidase 2 protein [Neofusicoccum parvum UCRNP2]